MAAGRVPLIELKGTQKVVDGAIVVNVDALRVRPGEVAALVGPSGSGKGQLLHLVTGRARPTAGTVRIGGVDPFADRAAFSRTAGVLFSEDGLYKQRSVLSNLHFHCRLWGLPKSRAEEVMRQVGLADCGGERADRLGSGLARRLAFGRAIVHSPRVLLLAEPFARCDEASIGLLSELIRRQAEDGSAVLILADTVSNLNSLCDRIYGLEQGRVVESHAPAEEEAAPLPFKIPARREGKVAVVLVNPADILYAEAEEGKALLHTAEGPLSTRLTLSELEQRLSRSGFFRAHRGYLVNLQHVSEVIPYTRNSFSLRLADEAGTEIPLSKMAAAELKEMLGY
jgi:ABC-2 type transport system ATP-binding protein